MRSESRDRPTSPTIKSKPPSSSANGLVYKQYNWQTLNQKVFRALGLHFTAEQLLDAAAARPGAAEAILAVLKTKLESLQMTEGPGGGSATSAKHVGRTTSSGSVGAGDTIQAVHAAPAVDTQAELIAHFQQTIEVRGVSEYSRKNMHCREPDLHPPPHHCLW